MQDWTREQIVWALRKWNRDCPRIRPTPGDIVAICKRERGRRIAAEKANKPAPTQAKERVSKERAAEIIAQAGFAPKRMPTDE